MESSVNGFRYDTHLHTSEGSACGRSTGAEMARAYADAGYTGIIVTDHFVYGNTAVDRSLPWSEWVERFCLGFEHAKAEGDRLGLQVFFGWESNYQATEFLVYGLDKQWLLAHPEIKDATIPEQLTLVHEGGGMISQAHPYREAFYINEIRLFPKYVDAVEGVNASHSSYTAAQRHPEYNDRALAYAKKYHLPLTAGSDQHSATMLWGGMVFPRKLKNIGDFIRAVKTRETTELLDGSQAPIHTLEI